MTRSRSRIVVAGLLTALTAAACTGDRAGGGGEAPATTDPPPFPPAAAEADWQPCPELLDELLGDVASASMLDQLATQTTYECATVAVPQDWSAPDAPETFDIALVRARSNDQGDRIGSLFVNPGGPGASGVEAAVYLSLGPGLGGLPDEVTSRFDVIGFDPRGVGRSSPVECFTDADLDEAFGAEPDPRTPAAFDAAVADSEQLAEACRAKYGQTLDYFSTEQTAHDLDALRAAVGDDRLSYLGFSYGTLLGAVYAQLYPDKVRALVLDGAVDPQQDTIEASEDQARGFERALGNFSDWCDRNQDDCPLRPDARTAITEALDEARRSAVPGEDGREATAGWIFYAVVATLYTQDRWPALGEAIDRLAGGDPSEVFALADAYADRDPDGTYSNLFDANNAVNCADDTTDLTVPQVRDLQQQWRQDYPLFGAPLAVGLLTCAQWPAASDPYPTGPAEGAPPILVVGTRGDPATPYESAPELAQMLESGVVLTWEGEGHTAYPGTGCIDDAVNAYLVDLIVPEPGTSCPAR